jgi:hypothetical protein
VLFPDRGHFPAGACRSTAASPCTPPYFPPARIALNEASTKGSHVFARPVFPSPVAARMERAALGLTPRASHPADQEPDNARRGGDRPSSTDLELHAQLTSVDLQSDSSLVACDLASHVAKRSSGAATIPAGRERSSAPRRAGRCFGVDLALTDAATLFADPADPMSVGVEGGAGAWGRLAEGLRSRVVRTWRALSARV